MNEDIYAEWLVKRKDKAWTIPAVIGMGLVFFASILLMFFWEWGFVVTVLAFFGCLMGFRFLHVEYEYVFVTNELAIDRIYNQNMRKKGPRIEMDKVESVEKTGKDQKRMMQENRGLVVSDYSSGMKDASTYTILFTAGGKRNAIIFEPNEKVLRAMWRCSPSKVHIER